MQLKANTYIKKGENSMRNKYGIGFLMAGLAAFIVMGVAYDINYKIAKEQADVKEQKLAEEQSVTTEGQAFKEDCFFLMEVNGYVAVYGSDRETVYEYTDILVSELPYVLQNEIKNGKYIDNVEELYGFLENYSS